MLTVRAEDITSVAGTGLPGGQVFAQLDGQSFEMRSILKTKTAHW